VIVPRFYQVDTVERVRRVLADLIQRRLEKWVILQAATGAGKTVMAAMLIKGCADKGKRCLFLAPSRELIHQCSDKLSRFDVEHGIIMAGHGYNLDKLVQVASKDTLISRAFRLPGRIKAIEKAIEGATDLEMHFTEKAREQILRLEQLAIPLPAFDLIIADECHLSLSKTWFFLLKHFPNAVVIGLTATPARGDGKPLGMAYKGMVQAVPTSKLIADGYLVPTKVFAPYRPDLKGVPTSKATGDYAPRPLEKRMDQPKLVGDIVEHWKRLARGRKTIAFASGIEHSLHIRDQFLAAGIKAEHLDGKTPDEERDAILERFSTGDTMILVNCNVLTLGYDCPIASCCIDAGPTRSYVKFRQRAGRIQRPADGKTDAILIDHSGNVYVHGLPDADVDWQLKEGEKIQDRVKPKDGRSGLVHCPKCHAIFSGLVCPACGHKLSEQTRQAKREAVQNGQLVEVSDGKNEMVVHEAMVREWHRCMAISANMGRTPGMAAQMFKKEFGVMPWEVRNLPNVPARGQWKTPVAELFPQYVRRKRA
jgi:DNA repair protein RadD